MMNIPSYVLNFYWLMRAPLSVVNVSIKILLTGNLPSSVFFQACHDLFWAREKFLFALFSYYSLVVRTHMGWHVWPIFFAVISLVSPYCTTPLLTRVIHHTYDTVHCMAPTFTSRCQPICQVIHRFTSYSALASQVCTV